MDCHTILSRLTALKKRLLAQNRDANHSHGCFTSHIHLAHVQLTRFISQAPQGPRGAAGGKWESG